MSVSTPSRSVYFFGSIAAYIWKCKVLNNDNAVDDDNNNVAINDPCNRNEVPLHSNEEEEEQPLYVNLKASVSVPSCNEPCIEETFGAISSTSPLPLHSFECAPGASMRALFLPVLIEKAHCLSPKENKNSTSGKSSSCGSDECAKNEMNSLTLNVALTLQLSSTQDCQSTNVQITKTSNNINNNDHNKDNNKVVDTKSYVSSLEESSTIEITKPKTKSSVRLIQWGHAEKIVKVKEVDVMSHNDECMLVKIGICYDKPSQTTQDNQNNSIIINNKSEQETRENMAVNSTSMEEQIHAEVYIMLRVINLTSTMCLLLIADDALNKFIRSESTELLANKLHDSMTVTVSPVDDFPRLQYNPDNQICMDHSEYKNNKCSQSSLSYLSFGAIPLTELYRHYRLLCGVAFNKIIKHSNAVLKLLMPATNLHSHDSHDSNNDGTDKKKSKYSELYENTSIDENRFAHSLVRLSAQTRAKRITSTHIHETNTQTKENKKEHPENSKASSEYLEKLEENQREEEEEEESSVILQTFIAFRWDTLHSLSLERVMLGDNACAPLLLTLSHCVNLQQFNGDHNELGDATCARLFALFKSHRTLQSISLTHNRIYDTGAWWLLRLVRCNSLLTCVNVEHNPTSAEMMHHIREACDKNRDMRSCNVYNVFANQYNYLTSPLVLSNEIIHKATCVWSALVARTVGEIDVWVRNSTTMEFNQFVDETAAERKRLAELILQSEEYEEQEEFCENNTMMNNNNKQSIVEEKDQKALQVKNVNNGKHINTMNYAIPRVARAPLLNEVIRTVSNKINHTTINPLVQLVFMDMVEALSIPGVETYDETNYYHHDNINKENVNKEQQEEGNLLLSSSSSPTPEEKKNKKSKWERALAECVTSDRYYVSFLHLLITLMHGIVFEVNWNKVKKLLQLIGQYQRQLSVMPEDYITAITAIMNALHVIFGVTQTKWTVTSNRSDHSNANNNSNVNKSYSSKGKERTTNNSSSSCNKVVATGHINIHNSNNNNNNNNNNNKDDILSGDYLAAFLMVLALGVRTAVLDI